MTEERAKMRPISQEGVEMAAFPKRSQKDLITAEIEEVVDDSEIKPKAFQAQSVTFRILVISTVLIFINCYWIIEVEGIWHVNHATAMSLFWNSTFFLLLLVLINIFLFAEKNICFLLISKKYCKSILSNLSSFP